MSFLSIGKIVPVSDVSEALLAEVHFDGRNIGSWVVSGESLGRFEPGAQALPCDIAQASAWAGEYTPAKSLTGHLNELFRVAQVREQLLRKMRLKLRKNTLFTVPGQRPKSIAMKYCESIRSRIKREYPDAVILNTLSEDEAFRHYSATPS